MKKILIPLAVAAALTLPSCESFLTQENPNKIESGFYFKDESSLEIYTNGFIRSFATEVLPHPSRALLTGTRTLIPTPGMARPHILWTTIRQRTLLTGPRRTGHSSDPSTITSTICARLPPLTLYSTIMRESDVSSGQCSISPR